MILTNLGVEIRTTRNGLSARCPIHNGDDYNLRVYISDKFDIPVWRCFSHSCHSQTGKSLINLISALLQKTNPTITFYQTVDWLLDQYEVDTSVNIQSPTQPKPLPTEPSFNFGTSEFPAGGIGLNIDEFRDLFDCPSPYFQSRGIPAELLKRHAIGDCHNPSHPMYQRACIPFFNPAGNRVIGIQGRSLYEKCLVCRQFHSGLCYQKNNLYSPKWENTSGFLLHAYFYPYWANAHIIRSLGSVTLVEGVIDSLALEAAGLRNSLAILGSDFTHNQKLILHSLDVKKVILATDRDEPGMNAGDKIYETLKKEFEVIQPELPSKDLGEMTGSQIRRIFEGLL